MNQQIIAIYTGVGLNAPANNIIRVPSVDGVIKSVYLDFPSNTAGDALFNLTIDGASLLTSASLKVLSGNSNVNVTGLVLSMVKGKVIALNLESPVPSPIPDPPWSLVITYEDGIVNVGSSSSGIGGEQGDPGESFMIPGAPGPAGATGPAGPTGAGIQGLRGLEGPEGPEGEFFMIPGAQGPQGSQGPAGTSGSGTSGSGQLGEDGQDGEAWMIPGPQGPGIIGVGFAKLTVGTATPTSPAVNDIWVDTN